MNPKYQTPNKKQSQKTLLVYIISVFVIISFLVVYVHQKVKKNHLQTQIQKLRKQKTRQTREYLRLKVQVYELSSRKRIEKIAKEKLDMHYPKLNEEYFILE